MDQIKEKKILSASDLLDRLKEEDWTKLIKQLHYYSLNRLQRYHRLDERFNINNLSTHFADEAIRQLWMQERIWDVNHYADVYDFLKGAVDSLRYNFLKSKAVNITTYIDEFMEDTIKANVADPESQMVIKELEIEIKQIFSTDLEAYHVFECLKNEIAPRHISTDLNIPIKQVYNAIKRIERKLTDLRTDLAN